MKEKNLIVAYSSDDNYAKFLGISMYSLFQSNTEMEQITVYIMDAGIKQDSKDKLLSVANEFNREVVFVNMDDALSSLDLHMGARKISIASYARLFMTTIIPESVDRIIYLDCDTIIMDSLYDMWNTEMGTNLIAGVQDTVDTFYHKIIGLEKSVPYFNAGILLINLEQWRREDMQTKFLDIIKRFDGNVPHHDQGCINCASQERRTVIDVRYNFTSNMYSFSEKTIKRIYFIDDFYSQAEIDAAKAKPAIVHFTSGLVGRPWEENCTHPMKDAFWSVVKKTPWADLEMQPDSRKMDLKLGIIFHKIMPRPIFEFTYRNASWIMHLRK